MPDSEANKTQIIPDPRKFTLTVGKQWVTTDVIFHLSVWSLGKPLQIKSPRRPMTGKPARNLFPILGGES